MEFINSRNSEYLEDQKVKFDDIEKDISEKTDLKERENLKLDKAKYNLLELRRGSNDGVLYCLKKQSKLVMAAAKKDKK